MDDVKKQFEEVLYQELIPSFCSRSDRNMTREGFHPYNPKNLSEKDMADFLRGWREKLLVENDTVSGSGLYKAPLGGSKEQFFWSGPKAISPRRFYLWLEPVIALGVLARLHLDFKWPRELIGCQTKPAYAFDVFGCTSIENEQYQLVCEVKKSSKEIDVLVNHMQAFGLNPGLTKESLPRSAEKNAFMKVQALRQNRAHTFWAVGPGRYERVFWVEYSGDMVKFVPPSEKALKYRARSASA